jgi:hypothetical protein
MPFCPQCKAEYTEEISICADCQVELVAERPPDDEVEYVDWESVHHAQTEVDGNMVKGIQEGAGISVVLRSHGIAALGGIKEDWSEADWGEVLVHVDDLEKAKEVVEEYLASLPEDTTENQEIEVEI